MIPEKKSLIFIFLLLLVLFQHPANINSQQEQKQIVYASPISFTETDVFQATTFASREWMSTIFAGLYGRDLSSDREYRPLLAKNMPNAQKVNETDGTKMIVTVELKPSLMFSNGDPLTAEDVAYTYQLYLNPNINSPYGLTLQDVFKNTSNIVVVDSTHIQFRFKRVTSNYIGYISYPIVPEEIYHPAVNQGTFDFSDYNTFLIGAGPFKLEELNQNTNILEVDKNPYWYTTGFPDPLLNKIIFQTVEFKDTAVNMFKNKEVDILSPIYGFNPAEASNISNAISAMVPNGMSQEMSINHIHPVWGHTAQLNLYINKTFAWDSGETTYTIHSFWNDISQGTMNENERIEAARLVREAMSHAIPREQIISEILNGNGFPAATIIPPKSIGYIDLPPREYNLTKAKQLIVQAFQLAGWNNITTDNVPDLYRNFQDWSINFLSPDTRPERSQWINRIANEFPQIGINVTSITITGWNVVLPRTLSFYIPSNDYNRPDGTHTPVPLWNQGGYDAFFIGYVLGLDVYISNLYETSSFRPYGFNYYNYFDYSYDALSNSYSTELNFTRKTELLHQIQQYLYDYQPAIPIIAMGTTLIYREGINGLDPILFLYQAQQWWLVSTNFPHQTTTTNTTSSNTNTSNKTTTTTTSPTNHTTTPQPFLPFPPIYGVLATIAMITLIISNRRRKQ